MSRGTKYIHELRIAYEKKTYNQRILNIKYNAYFIKAIKSENYQKSKIQQMTNVVTQKLFIMLQ